jgi:DNA-binding XRE family transcriptional regulator
VAQHKHAEQREEVPMTEYPAADSASAAIKPTLREARLEFAFSVHELATRAGVAPRTSLLIERDEATPQMATIRKLSAALGCRPRGIAWPGDPFTECNAP